jgi:hypothetical protein
MGTESLRRNGGNPPRLCGERLHGGLGVTAAKQNIEGNVRIRVDVNAQVHGARDGDGLVKEIEMNRSSQMLVLARSSALWAISSYP